MILQGNNLLLLVNGKAVAASKSCKISVDADKVETSSHTTGRWKTYKHTRNGWEVSCNAFVFGGDFANVFLVGTEVELTFNMRMPGSEHHVSGVTDATVRDSDVLNPTGIYFHNTLGKFVAKKNTSYFMRWHYSARPVESYFVCPSVGDVYLIGYTRYAYNGQTMKPIIDIQGSAIITKWETTASRGSLLMGNFAFLGNGPLINMSEIEHDSFNNDFNDDFQ